MIQDKDGVFRFELGLTESLNNIPDNNPMGFMKSEQWKQLSKSGSDQEQKQFIKWWFKKLGIEDQIRKEYKKDLDKRNG